MAVGSFIAASAQLAVQIWQARQDRALLLLAMAEGISGRAELASRLDIEQRLGIIGRIVNKLVPERFGGSSSLLEDGRSTKKEWMSAWIGPFDPTVLQNERSRSMLVPSPDWTTFTVYKPIYWTPDPGVAAGVPPLVVVPTGFVTDLATIPVYFWWAIRPAGRHGDAAIIHDWLYTEQKVTREVADHTFEVVMGELGVPLLTRKIIWAAVRVFGGPYWEEAARSKVNRQGE
jgi:Protein of unknown function (DUF1353)